MASLSTHHGLPSQQPKQLHGSAATVGYDDALDASLQAAWSTVMDQCAYYKIPSFYKNIKCLLISWDKDCDDLHTDEEVSELADVLENTFRYKVIRKLLNSKTEKLPQHQLMKHIADFVHDEDGHRTLLLVYYAGHGSPKSAEDGRHGLTLTGRRTLSDDPKQANEIVWDSIERNLNHTRSDVLEIFDCCYAGDLTRDGQTWSRRSFEFLGACSSGNTTASPGPQSFTKALIWAMRSLAKEETRFTVSGLTRRIRGAPNFPDTQVPVQFDRGSGSIENIMLAPLPEVNTRPDNFPTETDVTEPQGLLNLNIIWDKPPTKDIITNFGENLNRFINRDKIPVNRIVWGGLASWEGLQSSARAHTQKLAAVKLFKEGFLRKTEKRRRESEQAATTGLHTPMSYGERVSLSPSPSNQLSRHLAKKRKRSNPQDPDSAIESE